ncbi:MAG TPA: HAD-IA family hydrolase, partial [Verrucomicrobiae bacterium]|nr:HAD-IA family hydrolase [Verrucomicrobiae bacterium]
MDPNRFTHLTFDCYGTLIDWETGILAALLPLFQRSGATPEQILQRYVFHEARLEGMSWRPYRQVLAEVSVAMADDFQTELTGAEAASLAESVANWPPFTDTVAALRQLKDRYKLVIVSNVDDDLFVATARLLEVPFDDVITAQQVKSYKPATAHFHEALRRM